MAENLVVVNADGPEVRVGVVEDGRLAEFLVERPRERGIVGNIYKARVKRVLPGMQAAFVDLGPTVDKDAFLYAGDVVGAIDDVRAMFDADGDVDAADAESEDEAETANGGRKPAVTKPAPRTRRERKAPRRIEELIKEGQTVLVQVVKDAIGQKGARVTGYISLPGRYLVFMPMVEQSGVSRRFGSDRERKRIRHLIEGKRPKGTGFIARTAAEGALDDEVSDDAEFLVKLWNELRSREEGIKAPNLVYADLDLVLKTVRDRLTDDIGAVILDDEQQYERARKFVAAFMPRWGERLKLYTGRQPVFDHYGLEAQLRQAMQRKVPLKSGGSLVIDQGEAMTTIDINTGSFVGRRDLEETITKNNLEACDEVVNQLRLRNIGGIIVIDFVDMEQEDNRKKVLQRFVKALEKDHSRCNVTKISELGLVEMTRKRTRESLLQLVSEACPACDGRGRVKSLNTVAYEILRELRRVRGGIEGDLITVTCAPRIAELLNGPERDYIDGLEKRFHKKIDVKGSAAHKPEEYKVIGGPAQPKRKRGGRKRKKNGDEAVAEAPSGA
jgi:ribonuclease G